MTKSRAGLAALLVAATAGTAGFALLLAGLFTAPVVRSAAEQAGRQALQRQADVLARLPVAERLTAAAPGGTGTVGIRGLALGAVRPGGAATGAATALSDAQRRALLAGQSVSTTGELSGVQVLVEGRPLADGSAIVLASPESDIDRTVAKEHRRLFLALLLALVAAVLAGALVARRLADPLRSLAGTARRIGAGERGLPVPESGTREVAEVADALRHLDAALSASEERQRLFLRSVSHELRTPLTAIRGYAESLADGSVAPEELAGVGDILVAESARLERYVDDLLALARLEGPELSLTFADTRLGDLLDDARAAWAERFERAGIALEVDVDPAVGDGAAVSTDAGRLRQVLDILTDNAVRVCPAGSTVWWAARLEPDGVRLEVRDSGPGLSEDDLPVAFEPGVLRDRYAATRPVGQGLGLATAHGLVVRLGGALTAGRAPEGGAEFVVRLPAAPR